MKAKIYYNGTLLLNDKNVYKCHQKAMLNNQKFYGVIWHKPNGDIKLIQYSQVRINLKDKFFHKYRKDIGLIVDGRYQARPISEFEIVELQYTFEEDIDYKAEYERLASILKANNIEF